MPECCDCDTEPDPDEPEDDWHYRRVCPITGQVWWSLHCPHDGYQNPCPHCNRLHNAYEFCGLADSEE